MDTSLSTDTLHGIQPTRVADYMLDTFQAPGAPCTTAHLGVDCTVRHTRDSVIDSESSLLGLDRMITKQEPPAEFIAAMRNSGPAQADSRPKQKQSQGLLDSFSPFEPVGTRTKRPCNVLSGVTIDRFHGVHHSPQDLAHIVMNESHRGGSHTRMNAKDDSVTECGGLMRLKPVMRP